MSAESIAARLAAVRARIAAAAARAGRAPADVLLVGASKTVEPARLLAAYQAGLRDFGENYVQEAQAKRAALGDALPEARWHLIGHLQRNKVKTALDLFDIIQTLDSERLGAALARQVASGTTLPVLLEVDSTGLPERTGLVPSAVCEVVERLLPLPALELAGLMTVPAPGQSADETRAVYRALRGLRDELRQRFPSASWRHLSMGMTDDFELAIEEGATLVRIGRAIFGERP